MRRRQHVLPIVAAAVVVALLAWSFYAALASAATFGARVPTASESAAWVARLEASSAEPMPSGPPIPVVLGRVVVAGREAGGSWDGTTVRAMGPDGGLVAHELGHAFDDRDLDPAERSHLLALMGYAPGTPWANPRRWVDDLFCAWLACPDERFASMYAGCALSYVIGHRYTGARVPDRGRGVPWWSPGWVLSVADYGRICDAIRRYAS
jgi:hypothetical protein